MASIRNFAQSYYELLGSNSDGLAVEDETFTHMYNGYLRSGMTGSIDTYIRQSDQFANKHEQLVVKVHGLVSNSGQTLGQGTVKLFVNKFVSDSGYNIDKLKEDIIEIETANGSTPIENLNSCEKKVTADMPFLAAFEKEFERPMFVQEYFAYKLQYSSGWTDLPDLHAKFTDTYIAARQAYLNYIDKGLGMHEFVCAHLGEFEDAEFMARLTADMIASEDYTRCMQHRLSTLYKSMYDEALHEDDLGYLLTRVRDRSLPLGHDGLSTEVYDYRTMSISMGDRVEACFCKVLRRAAEPDELAANVRTFRRMIEKEKTDLTECDVSLRKNLIASLEFHDVLKDMIRVALSPREASTSQLYAALTEVLRRIDLDDDLDDVVVHVKKVIIG